MDCDHSRKDGLVSAASLVLGSGKIQESGQVSTPNPGQTFLPGSWSGFEQPQPGLCLPVSSGDMAHRSSDAPTWHLLNLIENSERGKVMTSSLFSLRMLGSQETSLWG